MSARLLGAFTSINIFVAMTNVAWSGVGRPESPMFNPIDNNSGRLAAPRLSPKPGILILDGLDMPIDDWRCVRDQLNALDLESDHNSHMRLDPDFSICWPPAHTPAKGSPCALHHRSTP